jgi:hypothetical protein
MTTAYFMPFILLQSGLLEGGGKSSSRPVHTRLTCDRYHARFDGMSKLAMTSFRSDLPPTILFRTLQKISDLHLAVVARSRAYRYRLFATCLVCSSIPLSGGTAFHSLLRQSYVTDEVCLLPFDQLLEPRQHATPQDLVELAKLLRTSAHSKRIGTLSLPIVLSTHRVGHDRHTIRFR